MRFLKATLLITALLFTFSCQKEKKTLLPGQLKPGSTEFILNEGIFYLNNGNIQLAEKKLKEVLGKSPNHITANNALGIVYTYQRDFDRAMEKFKTVLKFNPKHYDAYNSLGVIYTELNKYDQAKECLLIAANANDYSTPENAYVNLGKLEIKHKKFESALRYVEKGIAYNKTFAPLYNMKGVIMENLKEYKKAVYNYERAIHLLTDADASILMNLGRAYSRMGKKDQALDTLEKALSISMSEAEKSLIRALIREIE